jgi:hypothetical protein
LLLILGRAHTLKEVAQCFTLVLLGHKIFVELGCPEPGKS